MSTCAAQSRSRASRKEKTWSSSCGPSRGSISLRHPGPSLPPRLLHASAPLGQAPPTSPRFRPAGQTPPIPPRFPHACVKLTKLRPSHRPSASLGQVSPIPPHFRPAGQTPPIPPCFRRTQPNSAHPMAIPPHRPNPAHPATLPLHSTKPRPTHRASAPQTKTRPDYRASAVQTTPTQPALLRIF